MVFIGNIIFFLLIIFVKYLPIKIDFPGQKHYTNLRKVPKLVRTTLGSLKFLTNLDTPSQIYIMFLTGYFWSWVVCFRETITHLHELFSTVFLRWPAAFSSPSAAFLFPCRGVQGAINTLKLKKETPRGARIL